MRCTQGIKPIDTPGFARMSNHLIHHLYPVILSYGAVPLGSTTVMVYTTSGFIIRPWFRSGFP